MKKIALIILAVVCTIALFLASGVGINHIKHKASTVIGNFYGAEHEYILLNDGTVYMLSGSGKEGMAQSALLGIVTDNGEHNCLAYSTKKNKDTDGEYIKIIWEWEGSVYKKTDLTADSLRAMGFKVMEQNG